VLSAVHKLSQPQPDCSIFTGDYFSEAMTEEFEMVFSCSR
jgi:hypothetical protein